MKRYAIFITVCIVVATVFGCINPKVGKEKLPPPRNLTFDGYFVVSWDEVDNASGYMFFINGEIHFTKETFYLCDLSSPGECCVKVKSLGDGAYYTDSEFTKTIVFNVRVPE